MKNLLTTSTTLLLSMQMNHLAIPKNWNGSGWTGRKPKRIPSNACRRWAALINSEKLDWQTGSWEDTSGGDAELTRRFYQGLYNSIREGAPLEVSPQIVRRQVARMEAPKN